MMLVKDSWAAAGDFGCLSKTCFPSQKPPTDCRNLPILPLASEHWHMHVAYEYFEMIDTSHKFQSRTDVSKLLYVVAVWPNERSISEDLSNTGRGPIRIPVSGFLPSPTGTCCSLRIFDSWAISQTIPWFWPFWIVHGVLGIGFAVSECEQRKSEAPV